MSWYLLFRQRVTCTVGEFAAEQRAFVLWYAATGTAWRLFVGVVTNAWNESPWSLAHTAFAHTTWNASKYPYQINYLLQRFRPPTIVKQPPQF